MLFDIVTIFPQYFDALDVGLIDKAQKNSLLQVRVHNLRDFAPGNYQSVDHAPYGGGAGVVMRANVWGDALDHVLSLPVPSAQKCVVKGGRRILAVPSPSGVQLTQALAQELADSAQQIIFACGRYEGIDRRVVDYYRASGQVEVLEFSLGDYVLNGGEVASLTLIEAVSRLVEGMVGNPDSLVEESHCGWGALEYPVYTQPRNWRGLEVPAVLRQGDHEKIRAWRRERSLELTVQRREDKIWALDFSQLSLSERELLAAWGYACVGGQKLKLAFSALREKNGECLEFTVVDAEGDDARARLRLETAPAGDVWPQVRLEVEDRLMGVGLEGALIELAALRMQKTGAQKMVFVPTGRERAREEGKLARRHGFRKFSRVERREQADWLLESARDCPVDIYVRDFTRDPVEGWVLNLEK